MFSELLLKKTGIISVYSGILTVALSASKKGVGCIYRGNLFIIEHIKKDANNGN